MSRVKINTRQGYDLQIERLFSWTYLLGGRYYNAEKETWEFSFEIGCQFVDLD